MPRAQYLPNIIVTDKPFVDVRGFATLADAIAAVGSTDKTIVISDGQAVISNLVIPVNVTLEFLCGGMLNPATGITVTVNGKVNAGLYQIFGGNGDIVFGGDNIDKVFVQWFGATGDGTTDDTVSIQAASDSCSEGNILYFPKVSTYYLTSAKVSVAPNIGIEMLSNICLDDPTHLLTALEVGADGVSSETALRLRASKLLYSDWADDDCIGILLHQMYNSSIYIDEVSGFTVGCKLVASTGSFDGFAYNVFYLGLFWSNKIGLLIYPETDGWINENLFIKGRFGSGTGVGSGLARTGIKIDSAADAHGGGFYPNNSNIFIAPSLEMNSSEAAPNEAIGIDIVYGLSNRVINARNEGNTYGAVFRANARRNKISFSYGSSYLDESTYIDNEVISYLYQITPYLPLLSNTNLYELARLVDTDKVQVNGFQVGRYTTTVAYRQQAGIVINPAGYLELSGWYKVGTRISNLAGSEQFKVVVNSPVNSPGRICIRLFDVAGNPITDAASLLSGGAFYYSATHLGYITGSDVGYGVFRLNNVTIDHIDILVGGGTVAAKVSNMQIYGLGDVETYYIYPGYSGVKESGGGVLYSDYVPEGGPIEEEGQVVFKTSITVDGDGRLHIGWVYDGAAWQEIWVSAASFSIPAVAGFTGTFTNGDGDTVTVADGLITGIA